MWLHKHKESVKSWAQDARLFLKNWGCAAPEFVWTEEGACSYLISHNLCIFSR
jgi:hypothetical protein